MYACTGTRTNIVGFGRVLLSRVKASGFCRLPERTNLSRHPSLVAELLAARLGKLMNFNSWFNFKLSKYIGVFGYYIRGVIYCNEWKTEKRHEYTNMRKVKRLGL